ncbi:MAG: hypothetical protein KDC90_13570 [Ignavibacteriae bacterium]|nr:hypothetical protein [Ignavibacteriota bacterium]
MLVTILITLIILTFSMIIVAKGSEKKEKSSIECALSKFCEVEQLKQCNQVKESSINYIKMAGNIDELFTKSTKGKAGIH